MKKKLLFLLGLMVLLPLILLGTLLWQISKSEQAQIRQALVQLTEDQLRSVQDILLGAVAERLEQLRQLSALSAEGQEALRAFVRKHSAVRALLVLDAKGQLLHPPPKSARSQAENEFIVRAEQVWKDKSLFLHPPESEAQPGPVGGASAPTDSSGHEQGWYSWYHGNSLNLLHWQRLKDGGVIGVELDSIQLLSDLISRLPSDSLDQSTSLMQRIMLVDSRGEILYQWGGYAPAKGETPLARLTLAAPLGAWQLWAFSSQASQAASGAGTWIRNLLLMLPLLLSLLGLSFYLYRESTRQAREAQQRVSFVNQVTHELKTPLTNIRLYAELLCESAEFSDSTAAGHLNVVIGESQRLNRLIDNVLSFARQERGSLRIRLAEGVIDDAILRTLESFRTMLAGKEVAIETSLCAASRVFLDADAVGQILGNLLSNVEKYASSGKVVAVASRQESGRTFISVSDRGPGIPESERENIFKPFVRLSSKLTDGTAGTGIGLTIARQLARHHGGDIQLLPSQEGACFEISLTTAEVAQDPASDP